MHPSRRHVPVLAILIALTLGIAGCGEAASSIVQRDPPAPGPGDGQVVFPVPGQLDVRPIAIDRFLVETADRNVVVTAFFTSGVEPCAILDTVRVERGEGTLAITLHEGRGPDDVMCVAIAVAKKTAVDLGELAPGTWTIGDGTGNAQPVTIDIP